MTINISYWALYFDVARRELNQFEGYVNSMETTFNQQANKLEDWIVDAAALPGPEGSNSYEGWDETDAWEVAELFPALCYGSTLVTIYSFLESELVLMCKAFQRHRKAKLSLDSIRGSGIEQCARPISKITSELTFRTKRENGRELEKFKKFVMSSFITAQGSSLKKTMIGGTTMCDNS
jgi:hypothetical protein